MLSGHRESSSAAFQRERSANSGKLRGHAVSANPWDALITREDYARVGEGNLRGRVRKIRKTLRN